MAGLLIFNPTSFVLSLPTTATRASFKPPHKVYFPAVRFPGDPICRETRPRGLTVVTRAGPSTSSYIFAFLLPFSLVLITVFTSIRVADKLDEDFLEEVSKLFPAGFLSSYVGFEFDMEFMKIFSSQVIGKR